MEFTVIATIKAQDVFMVLYLSVCLYI